MTADPTHRHDHFHRGQVPTDQLADGTATTGYVPTSNGDDTVTWAPSGSGIPATIVDAKGDIIAATAADTVARLAAGSNDTILMADSGQTTGLKWVGSQTPSTQAFSDSAAEGTADTYARGDHKHGMPASPGGSGTLTTVKDEGTNLSTAVVSLDFVGAGVTATGTTAVTVTIPGGSGADTSNKYVTVAPAADLSAEVAHPEFGNYNGGSPTAIDFSAASTGTGVSLLGTSNWNAHGKWTTSGSMNYLDVASSIGTGNFDVRWRMQFASSGSTVGDSFGGPILTDSSRTAGTWLGMVNLMRPAAGGVPNIHGRTGDTNTGSTYNYPGVGVIIYRIRRSGTTYVYEISLTEGASWLQIETGTSSLNIAKVAIWANTNAATACEFLIDWVRSY